ncbi:MAG: 16S rRNA (cytosine(1402)-N(4))-methyltransferase RsmH [Ruminococcaceae bacterium]|nr:16S rRNA (cytosine(1402)-N(4))-methyltransferase RsmH [Oscillospiraceae bacterium]
MDFVHIPVLANECIEALNIKENGIYVDCTMGGAGHSSLIAQRLKSGRLIAIDQDDDAIKAGKERLSKFSDRVTVVKSNFSRLRGILDELQIDKVDGVLMDLGVSSFQLDSEERGFSYNSEARLDMRMDRQQSFDAYELVNTYSYEDLKRILFTYGEEKNSAKIASKIVSVRQKAPIVTTADLSAIIKSAFPPSSRWENKHPAKRSFQAIRMEVNLETKVLEEVLSQLTDCVAKDGRIAVITFHSLEDRLVKTAFTSLATGCICPKEFPVCVCGNKPKVKLITKKPITATQQELENNRRAHSAKLRVAQIL